MNELEEMENGPCYQSGDNDPVNGRFVNARHKKLCCARRIRCLSSFSTLHLAKNF